MSLTKHDIPTSYAEALKLLQGARNGQRRISTNGWLFLIGFDAAPQQICLKLHNTVIVRWYPDGSMQIDHGGWITATTFAWINRALPVDVRVRRLRHNPFITGGGVEIAPFTTPLVLANGRLTGNW